jgi:hypothetical protein
MSWNDLLQQIGAQHGCWFTAEGKTSRHLKRSLAKALAAHLQRKGFQCVIFQDLDDPKRYWVHVAAR